MALVVDGIPVRSDFLELTGPAVTRDLRVLSIGRQARLVT
jgi:hypothetical protein